MSMGARPEDLQAVQRAFEKVSRQATADRDASHERLSRLLNVLEEYFAYEPGAQIRLVDVAIDWTVACLASNKERATIEASFYRVVDAMYASTDHAGLRYSMDERERIYSEAMGCDQFAPVETEVIQASVRSLKSFDNDNPARMILGTLEPLRLAETREGPRLIAYADVVSLRELIQALFVLCVAIETNDIGGCSIEEVMQAAIVVGHAEKKVVDSIARARNEGKSREDEEEDEEPEF